jgi:FkbM family methyltransferase
VGIHADLSRLLPRKLTLCDVGARWGLEPPWTEFARHLTVIQFEPDPEEYALLHRSQRMGDVVLPYALHRQEGRAQLHLTAARGCSSLYEPNQDFLAAYPDAGRFKVEATAEVETSTLDRLAQAGAIDHVDFLKIDTQGAELDILVGGESLVRDGVVGLQVEVEFQPMYSGQPLFADVDAYVRGVLGLQLQDLRPSYWKYAEGIGLGGGKGQLIFGDALYLRAPDRVVQWSQEGARLPPDEAIQLCCFTGLVYGYLDYVLHLLARSDVRAVLGNERTDRWVATATRYGRSAGAHRGLISKAGHVLGMLAGAFPPTLGGWASGGRHLGLRKRFGFFY